MTIQHPPLRYHGGKWKIAQWVISHFPPHTCYVEPFAGGASVLLRKSPSTYEFYNDIDGQVVGFFRVLREQTDALIDAIKWTPFSRAEWASAWSDFDGAGTIEAARKFYVRSHQSFSNAPYQDHQTWRYSKSPRSDRKQGGISSIPGWNSVDHLYQVAARLKHVHIECDDAATVIKRTDGTKTLFYVDPPYVFDTRNRERQMYAQELTDADHIELACQLKAVQGMVVLSGYDSELYASLYGGWQKITRPSVSSGGGKRTECLWLSPNIGERQLELFDGDQMGGGA